MLGEYIYILCVRAVGGLLFIEARPIEDRGEAFPGVSPWCQALAPAAPNRLDIQLAPRSDVLLAFCAIQFN